MTRVDGTRLDGTRLDGARLDGTRERLVRWQAPPEPAVLAARSGREVLTDILEGRLAPPPIASLLGLVLVDVGEGCVTFEWEPHESALNPLGLVHGGIAATLADTVCGCAVHTLLPAGTGYSTIELAVSYLRPVTLGSGTLRATGVARKLGRRVAFAEAVLVDADDREVATATSSLLVGA